jgi:hypothetical protein
MITSEPTSEIVTIRPDVGVGVGVLVGVGVGVI